MNFRRWMTLTGVAALLVGSVAAQPSRAADEPQKEARVVSPAQPEAPAVKADAQAAPSGPSQPAEPMIRSHEDKISYALGADMGREILRQRGSVNVDLLMRALTDAVAGKKLIMTDEEVTATVQRFEAEEKEDLQHVRTMVSERNKREGEAFFAENARKEGVVTLPSGLQYKILKKGDGKLPTLADTVLCNYISKLVNGTEIDNSYKRKEPMAVPVKGVIAGFAQALQMMPVGSKWELYVPPQLGYGDKPTPSFGPNSTLIFELELLAIQEKPQAVSKR